MKALKAADLTPRTPHRCGGGGQAQYQNRHTDTEIGWFGAEASELVPALFSSANYASNMISITRPLHPTALQARQPTTGAKAQAHATTRDGRVQIQLLEPLG
eukprot:SAG25_NODE_5976_length_600_cov_0.632735_1_plen_101_part_10